MEGVNTGVPPGLPPHLLNVILNKEGYDEVRYFSLLNFNSMEY